MANLLLDKSIKIQTEKLQVQGGQISSATGISFDFMQRMYGGKT